MDGKYTPGEEGRVPDTTRVVPRFQMRIWSEKEYFETEEQKQPKKQNVREDFRRNVLIYPHSWEQPDVVERMLG